jgi:hypothetical protein
MAAITTTAFPIPDSAPAAFMPAVRSKRRRITPRAGHALEILGHAIGYLTDEFVLEATSFSPHNAQVEAVQLLMALNREVYFECPEVPSFAERCRTILHLGTA